MKTFATLVVLLLVSLAAASNLSEQEIQASQAIFEAVREGDLKALRKVVSFQEFDRLRVILKETNENQETALIKAACLFVYNKFKQKEKRLDCYITEAVELYKSFYGNDNTSQYKGIDICDTRTKDEYQRGVWITPCFAEIKIDIDFNKGVI